MRAPFRLPAAYLRALDNHAERELTLDWRALVRRRPAMWPGSLTLFARRELERHNAELRSRKSNSARTVFFIGTNSAGVLYGIERSGAVSIFDDVEMESVPLAASFSALLDAAQLDESPNARRERIRRYSRSAPAAWRRIELDG